MDLLAALRENLSKLGHFTEDSADYGLEDKNGPITAALCHVDSFLGHSTSLGQENFRVFPFHCGDCLRFLFLRRVNLEQVPDDGQVHKPGNPHLEEDTDYKDEGE